MQVAAALAQARQMGVERLDAHLLLTHLLGRPRTWLIAHDDAQLSAADVLRWLSVLTQRAAGVPLAYLVGHREFHGLRLAVNPAVLVPRPETELLVDWALARLKGQTAPSAVDLGTGSGAIAIALCHRRPDAHVTAVEVDAAALATARGNATTLGTPIEFIEGNWWQALPGRRFDLAVSNPPYIAGDDPHLPDLSHEPRLALTPGGDGLNALRQIVDAAPAHLASDAWLLLEHGHDQGAAVRRLLSDRGFENVQTRQDLAGLDRCSGGRWPGARNHALGR